MNTQDQTREQILMKIEFFLSKLSDRELRMALGFVRGLSRKGQDQS